MKRHDKKKRISRKIARERMEILFRMAEDMAENGNLELASRYVDLLLKISKKYNIKIPKEMRYRICRKCRCLLVPGRNATVRVRKGRVIIKCNECGKYKRLPFR